MPRFDRTTAARNTRLLRYGLPACLLIGLALFAARQRPSAEATQPIAQAAPTADASASMAPIQRSEPVAATPSPPEVEQLAPPAADAPGAAQAVEVVEAAAEADEEEADPYVINEAIGGPLTSSGVNQTSEAPETAAETEPEVVEDEIEAFASSAYQAPVLWGTAPQPVQAQKLAITARAADYSGECPKSSSLRQPALWQLLSASSRAEFPLPKLGSSVYGRKARQRFVVVDQMIFREGQALPNGVTLLKLRKATAVLSSAACVVEVPLRLLQR